MVFSSPIFIFGFLAAVMLCYYLVPRRWRNCVLLVFSLFFFYAWDMPVYALIMLASVTYGYFSGLLLGRCRKREKDGAAKAVLVVSVILNLSVLALFKYTDLFINGINSVLGTSIGLLGLALPIGISFYTFQTLSYTIDVYRGDCEVQHSFIDFAAYVTMFPQLIAGPIVRYRTVEHQLRTRRENFADFGYGVCRFAIGFAKKILIADRCYDVWNEISGMGTPSVVAAWVGAIAFTFQIYFDFSGYSDMAIGLGKMFGFTFLENFDLPYVSKSITEFWRRWHISLGTWFKEYVYIPLGGNRKGAARTVINLLIVWCLTGFWHGASWNYLLWGLYFGIILILEKLFLLKFLEKLKPVFRHIYALLLIVLGWVIFALEDFSQMITYFGRLFGVGNSVCDSHTLYIIGSNIVLFAVAVICSTSLPKKLYKKFSEAVSGKPKLRETALTVGCLVLLFFSTAFMIGENYTPFLYFRF